ncbi:MAG: alpha/beta fold hydrolase [Candidatus Veblenbacteria bacterium]|nr:alpha/beta fold hydrolase [Candidatus Veblenbacteria bacterium]MDZ4229536.1 alpha/beta fold hydrolase [Candidatus Veblenbacteria bacterium]
MNRVIIAHGWEGYPKEGWFPWLKRELEAKGFAVEVPQLPDTTNPRIEPWVKALATATGTPDRATYFVGHSMGCQTIARYLTSLPANLVVGGAVFVAGFFRRLTGLEAEQGVQETDRHWLGTPLDLVAVRQHLAASVAIFSTNDPFVPLDNVADFEHILGAKIIILPERGHFSGSNGCTELPEVRDAIFELAQGV